MQTALTTIRSPEEIDHQLAIIQQGVASLVDPAELRIKLQNKKQLLVKLGCDPTRPDLHVGHLIVLRKLRELQDLGHSIVLIVGDFTAMIGDPTGKSKTRPQLSLEESRENGETYMQQASKVFDLSKVSIVYNSDWLCKLNYADVIQLAGKYTVARMLERNDFSERYSQNQPISIHEFLYPLTQAFDSVHLRADLEIGGTDQEFNLLIGRDIQRSYGQEPQVVLTMPLLVGLDGQKKMSKSADNYIGITEPPRVMFEKFMRVPDSALPEFFTLLANLDPHIISSDGAVEAHRKLARHMVTELYSASDADQAEQDYNLVASGGVPSDVAEVICKSEDFSEHQAAISALLVTAGLTTSKSEARRFIEQRGVKVDGEVVSDPQAQLRADGQYLLSLGKNRFVRVRFV